EFTDVSRVDALPANQVHVRAEDAHPLPRLDFGGAQVGDVMIAVDGNPFLLQPFLVRVDVRLIGIAPRARLHFQLPRMRGVRVVAMTMMIVTVMAVIVMMRRIMAGFRMRPEMERGQSRKQTQPPGRRAFYKLASREPPGDKFPDPIFHVFHPSPPSRPPYPPSDRSLMSSSLSQ